MLDRCDACCRGLGFDLAGNPYFAFIAAFAAPPRFDVVKPIRDFDADTSRPAAGGFHPGSLSESAVAPFFLPPSCSSCSSCLPTRFVFFGQDIQNLQGSALARRHPCCSRVVLRWLVVRPSDARRRTRRAPRLKRKCRGQQLFETYYLRLFNPNSEIKKHRFERKALAAMSCDTKSNHYPRTKQCRLLFVQFSVPAKSNYAVPRRRSRHSAVW